MRTSFRLNQTIISAVVLLFGEKDMMANPLLQTKALLCGIILMLLFSPATRAADGTPVWTNFLSNGGFPEAIALDSNGNAVVAGQGPTVEYSNAGMPLWTNSLGNSFLGSALAIDGSGNVYVTGEWSPNNWDYVTIKYSGAGVPLWTNSFNGAGNGSDSASSVATDGNGNVFVTGGAKGIGSITEFATIKYSAVGVPLWTNIFTGTGNGAGANGLAVDSNGDVYVTGAAIVSSGVSEYATIKYSNAGLSLWTNFFIGSGNSIATAGIVDVAGDGNVYVTGRATGNGSGYDYATIKYSSAGVPLWTNIFNGAGSSTDIASGLAVDSNGDIYVTGSATGNGTGYDYATIKYSALGAPLWTNIFNGAANTADRAFGLALDGNGNEYVTGYTTLANNRTIYATIKYSNAGMPIWTNLMDLGGNNFAQAKALAVDGAGNVYVTGNSGTATYTTTKYSGPAPINFRFITTNGNFGFANNQFSLLLAGPPGSNAVISASTNLQTWVPLVTNPLTGGTLTFTDALATNFPSRLYRATLLP